MYSNEAMHDDVIYDSKNVKTAPIIPSYLRKHFILNICVYSYPKITVTIDML